MKEFLNKKPDGSYELIASNGGCVDRDWIEVPEGAEVAIKFKYDPDEFGVIFYKNNGKSCFSQKDKAWQNDADWTMKDLLNENYCEDGIDLSHDVLWQRESEAKPLVDWSHVINNAQQIFDHENAGKPSLNDQYAEIEQVRQAIKVPDGNDSDHALDAMSFGIMGAGAAQAIKDNVSHPSHYTKGKVECIDALESATIGKSGIEAVCVANIIKYLWRYEEKNGLEDVKKAQWYLERLVASMGS